MAGGYKLFSTGEVLTAANVNNYLMNQTVMVFASAAARTTALSGVLAEGMISYRSDAKVLEIYNGTTWMTESSFVSPLTTKGDVHTYSTTDARLGVGTTNQTLIVDSTQTTGLKWAASPQSTLSAKGSLVSASAANTLAELTVGSDGQTLVANSSQTTGLAYTNNFAAGKNAIINGAFNVWQRGTSFTLGAGSAVYTSDRYYYYSGTSGAATVSQQTFTPGTAPVSGYEGTYFYRINQTSGASTNPSLEQRIENVRTFAGQTVTVSFWAKSAGTTTFGLNFLQNFGTGGSPSATVSTTAIASGTATTTGWQRFTASVALPSISGKTIGTSGDYLDVNWYWTTSTTYTFDIWGVQVEAGSVATAFQTATGTLQGELAACQRYYYRNSAAASYNFIAGGGIGRNSTQIWYAIPLPVTMRTIPSSIDFANLASDTGASVSSVSALTLTTTGSANTAGVLATVGSATSGTAYMLDSSTSTGYVGLSAEL